MTETMRNDIEMMGDNIETMRSDIEMMGDDIEMIRDTESR